MSNRREKTKKIAIIFIFILCFSVVGFMAADKFYRSTHVVDDGSRNVQQGLADKIKEKVKTELLAIGVFGSFNEDNDMLINDNRGIPVIAYHSISDENVESPLVVSTERFREHMQLLKDKGYTTLTIRQVENYILNGDSIPDKSVLITFDDGYKDNYTNAFPILKEFHMNATIFVIPTYLDGQTYMTPDQVKEMSSYGIDIQSHTYTHKRLSDLSYDDQLKELELSKKELGEMTGKEVTTFAYPEGRYNDDTLKAAEKAGYKCAFTIKRGYADRNDGKFELDRVCVDNTYEGKNLLYVLKCLQK